MLERKCVTQNLLHGEVTGTITELRYRSNERSSHGEYAVVIHRRDGCAWDRWLRRLQEERVNRRTGDRNIPVL